MHKSFNYKFKVYYEDTDTVGIVYYANYLKFLERARSEALVDINLTNQKIIKDFKAFIIVKSCNIDFVKPAFLEDKLNIKSHLLNMSKTSFIMMQTIFKNKSTIASAKVRLVFVNEKRKPIKIPIKIILKLKPYLFRI